MGTQLRRPLGTTCGRRGKPVTRDETGLVTVSLALRRATGHVYCLCGAIRVALTVSVALALRKGRVVVVVAAAGNPVEQQQQQGTA